MWEVTAHNFRGFPRSAPVPRWVPESIRRATEPGAYLSRERLRARPYASLRIGDAPNISSAKALGVRALPYCQGVCLRHYDFNGRTPLRKGESPVVWLRPG